MKVYLLFLLLSVIPDSISKVQELRVDVDFRQDDVLQIYSPDVYHCQLACTQHPSCLFFTFLRPDWKEEHRKFYCYLKHTASGFPSQVVELKGVTSGFPLTRQQYEAHTCLSSIYQNVDFTGSDYRELTASSYEECQKICSDDAFCQFFSYLTKSFPTAEKRNRCFLKYSWTVPIPPVLNTKSALVSGFSQSLFKTTGTYEEECQVRISPNTDFPGNDFEQVPAVSAEHCQFLCSTHPHCNHFSYSSNKYTSANSWFHRRCFLKYKEYTSDIKSVKNAEVYSGFPTRNCTPSNEDWATTSYTDLDFLGADNHFVIKTSPEACQNTCTEDPDCQFYTYVHPYYPELIHRNRCYLKQVMTLPRPTKVVSMYGVVSGFSLRGCKATGHKVYLLLLVVFVPDFSAKADDQGMRVDVELIGNVTEQIYSPDPYHCQLACTQHHSCRFFTYLRADCGNDDRKFHCYLKNTETGLPSKVNQVKGVTSGFPLPHRDLDKEDCLSSLYQDVEFTGSHYRVDLSSSSPDQCQEICTNDPDCKFFSFFTESCEDAEKRKKCYLKFSWTVPSPPRAIHKRDVISGFSQLLFKAKNTSQEECTVKKEDFIFITDNYFERPTAVSFEHCHSLCTIHPSCNYFLYSNFWERKDAFISTEFQWKDGIWVQTNRLCILYAKKPMSQGQNFLDGPFHGEPGHNCQLSNDWATKDYTSVDFNSYDYKSMIADDDKSCQHMCTSDPDCHFYTYILPSSSDDNRRMCYLKKVMTLPRPKVVSMRGVISGFSQRSCKASNGTDIQVKPIADVGL